MDTAFFLASKIIRIIIDPGVVILLLILSSAVLSWTRWRKLSRILLSITALICLFLVTIPMGNYSLQYLENYFPINPPLPKQIDGIIVLGGTLDASLTAARNQLSLNGSVERITNFAKLANLYPSAKLIYTGGTGSLTEQAYKEAQYVSPILKQLGVNEQNLILESQSRNTYENAIFSYDLASPKPNETWILITSARHMPRAIGTFRAANWSNIIPYPVDFIYKGDEIFGPSLNLRSSLNSFTTAIYEWSGLLAYYLTNKTNNLIPTVR